MTAVLPSANHADAGWCRVRARGERVDGREREEAEAGEVDRVPHAGGGCGAGAVT